MYLMVLSLAPEMSRFSIMSRHSTEPRWPRRVRTGLRSDARHTRIIASLPALMTSSPDGEATRSFTCRRGEEGGGAGW
jgi:hypothetical protein